MEAPTMSMVLRGKKVRLAAIFEPGKPVRPVWFELNRRQHKVLQTTYHWQDRVGDAELLHFTVSDGEALFELIYNLKEQHWSVHAQQPASP
jgi:hypothetical protein